MHNRRIGMLLEIPIVILGTLFCCLGFALGIMSDWCHAIEDHCAHLIDPMS